MRPIGSGTAILSLRVQRRHREVAEHPAGPLGQNRGVTRAPGDAAPPENSVSLDYFTGLYLAKDDPWDVGTKWHDQRKYAVTMAGLPRKRYRRCYEPGCSVGLLTRLLAGRCDEVLAVDCVPEAVRTAAEQEEMRRSFDRSRVDMMRAYAETDDCRRAFILSYFGEPFEPPCGRCDNCEAGRVSAPPADVPFAVGARVAHGQWGEGVVQRYDEGAMVVLFDDAGYKTLALEVVRERVLLTAV